MQKSLSKIVAFTAIILAVSFSASAQIYVKVRPTYTVVARPPAPSPAHVWVDEEWTPRGGTYVYSGGYWAAPPHPGYFWVRGHWARHGYDGERWVPGHWRRR
jgi:hypothetical protein